MQPHGRVHVYKFDASSAQPLTIEAQVDGPSIPNGVIGLSWFGGQEAVAVDGASQRILVGTTYLRDDSDGTDDLAQGRDVIVIGRNASNAWTVQSKLQPPLSAPFRGFGHGVAFADGNTALVAMFSATPSILLAPTDGAILTYSFTGSRPPPPVGRGGPPVADRR
jgi:hypothetical protein